MMSLLTVERPVSSPEHDPSAAGTGASAEADGTLRAAPAAQQELFSPQELQKSQKRTHTSKNRSVTRTGSTSGLPDAAKKAIGAALSGEAVTPEPPSSKGIKTQQKVSRKRTPAASTQRKRPAAARKKKSMSKKAITERRSTRRFVIALALTLLIAAVSVLIITSGRDRAPFDPESLSGTDVSSSRTFAERLNGSTGAGTFRLLSTPEELPKDHRLVTIASGSTASDVCDRLEAEGVFSPRASGQLLAYLTEQGLDTRIRSGVYLIPESISIEHAALMLSKGFSDWAVLSFYAGMTISQIDDHLSARGIIGTGEFLTAAESTAAAEHLAFSEGFFFPDVYAVTIGPQTAQLLAQAMHRACVQELHPYLEAAASRGLSAEELIIIASMIERETADPYDMPIISSVIANRIDQGMPLGIDATTRYESGDWSGPITLEQLQADTPYNTRRRPGLPPTGISNPGRDALAAAALPAQTSFLYYLHDRDGIMHPSETYAEHLDLVQQYLR